MINNPWKFEYRDKKGNEVFIDALCYDNVTEKEAIEYGKKCFNDDIVNNEQATAIEIVLFKELPFENFEEITRWTKEEKIEALQEGGHGYLSDTYQFDGEEENEVPRYILNNHPDVCLCTSCQPEFNAQEGWQGEENVCPIHHTQEFMSRYGFDPFEKDDVQYINGVHFPERKAHCSCS